MKLLLCIILAPLPSIIWLAFYLRKDKHPEPNKMILKVFFLGVLMVPMAGILEQGLFIGLNNISLLNKLLVLVVGFALIEEVLKYLTVKLGVLKSSALDEPVDTMIYLIIAALGFAAAENIYLLSQFSPINISISSTLEFITTRFLGATLLHGLASAIMGYFLATSLLIRVRFRKLLFWAGMLGATILHSVFNYIIILNNRAIFNVAQRNLYLLILLVGMAIIVSLMFKKINKYRSICKT